MATYVQGYQMYDREAKPFVPDYKFLSTVLETRQNRYDTNYQALNDAYSKVVYADLSRDDNKEKRDQFAQQIAPKMEQVSGFDLSLRQNVDMAKGIFKPFYEDDAIIRDLTNTANFKYGIKNAEFLKNSNDKAKRDLYWETGVQDLNIQMQDYINASPDEALNMGIGNYVPNANLYETSLALLKEQGFNVEIDRLDKKGRWIITQKNGALVTDQAYAYLNRALMDDPRVIEAYKTSARVQARNFANARLEAGEVASVAQGEEMWANTTIEEISTNTAALLKDKKKKAEVMKVSADLWKAYNEKYNIGADTPDGKKGEDFTSRYLAIRQEIEQGEDIVNNAVSAQGTRDKDLMNKAFMMNMQYNINDDMMAAAKSYSMIDYKESIKANPYGVAREKHKMDMAKMIEEYKLKAQLEQYKKSLENPFIGPLLPGVSRDGAANVEFEIDRNGNVKSTSRDNIAQDDLTKQKHLALNQQQKVSFIKDAHQYIQSNLEDGSVATIEVPGQGKMSLNEAQVFLSNPANADVAEQLFQTYSSTVLENNSNPNASINPEVNKKIQSFRRRADDIRREQDKSIMLTNKGNEIAYNNFQYIAQTEYGKNVWNAVTKQNVPTIFNKNTDGSVTKLSEEDFINQFINRAEANQIKKRNGKTQDYYETVGEPDFNAGMTVRDGQGGYKYPTKYVTRFDREAARKDAKEQYDAQKTLINATLNGAIDLHAEEGNPQYNSPFERFSYAEGLENVSPSLMTGDSARQFRGYDATFNPKAPTQEGLFLLRGAINQFNSGTANIQFGDITESEVDADEATTLLGKNDAVAERFFEQAVQDIQAFMGDKSGEGKNPRVQIEYMPVAGPPNQGDKTHAAYVIKFDDDYIKQFVSKYDAETQGVTERELRGLLGELSIVFPQTADQSQYSVDKAFGRGNSDYEIDMTYSEDNNVTFDVEGGGSLSFYKDGANFMMTGSYVSWSDEKQDFVVNDKIAPMIVTIDDEGKVPATSAEIDYIIEAFKQELNDRMVINTQKKENFLNNQQK